jgi:hypothetical protein
MKIPKHIKPKVKRTTSGLWFIWWMDYPLSEKPLPPSAMIEHQTLEYFDLLNAWQAFKDYIK